MKRTKNQISHGGSWEAKGGKYNGCVAVSGGGGSSGGDDDRLRGFNVSMAVALSSSSPKPHDVNVEHFAPTPAPATMVPLVSEEAVDPKQETPPRLGTLTTAELCIKRANLLSMIDKLKQQAL